MSTPPRAGGDDAIDLCGESSSGAAGEDTSFAKALKDFSTKSAVPKAFGAAGAAAGGGGGDHPTEEDMRKRYAREKDAWLQIKNTDVREGDTWFLVPGKWYQRWAAFAEHCENGHMPELGPMDFSDIMEADGELKKGLSQYDYELIPAQPWIDVLKPQYARDSPFEIKRTAVCGVRGNIVAVYPMRLQVLKTGAAMHEAKHLKILASETVGSFKLKACK